MEKIGIIGIGTKIPKKRLSVDNTINIWKNVSPNYVKGQLGVNMRSVLDSDEDLITLSVEAAKNCLSNANYRAEDIMSIALGTCTDPDLFNSNATMVMNMLTGKNDFLSYDIKNSEQSGALATISAYALVKSNVCNNSLVIGADILGKHTAPGDIRESYIGSGAAAMFIGKENVIAEIKDVATYTSYFPECGRPEDERFYRSYTNLVMDVLNEGMVQHCRKCVTILNKKTGMNVNDYDYGVFQQFDNISPTIIAYSLGMNILKVRRSLFAKYTGDTGSASPLIGLAKVLEKAKPKEKILLCSYGHGAGASAIVLEVTERIVDYQANLKSIVQDEMDKEIIVLNYADAMKYEHKLIQPNVALSTFL